MLGRGVAGDGVHREIGLVSCFRGSKRRNHLHIYLPGPQVTTPAACLETSQFDSAGKNTVTTIGQTFSDPYQVRIAFWHMQPPALQVRGPNIKIVHTKL